MLQPYFDKERIEAGCDEAGRGCLAGPVFAAAVILPKDFYHPLLNDSKQLSEATRYTLRPIIEAAAIAYGVASLPPKEIDKINILKASFKCMHLAIKKLVVPPELLLIDGNRFTPYKKLSHRCVIQGDGIYASIAAASILAKTYRDDYMVALHQKAPRYGWSKNKGYGTREHQEALDQYGPSRWHRQSFRLVYNGTSLSETQV
jgi:ribonuclease HII